MKVITRRDMAVVQVIMTLMPDVAGMTITKYTGHDPNAPEYELASVRVPGIHDELGVKLIKRDSAWIPLWVSVPGGSQVGEFGSMYAVTKIGSALTFVKRQ